MSLKYRLIILTVAVFVVVAGVGTLLAVHGARRLARRQAQSRLRSAVAALADSAAPLTDEVLDRLAPVLDARVLVIADPAGGAAEVLAHSGGDWPWRSLAEGWAGPRPPVSPQPAGEGQRYHFAAASRANPATGRSVQVMLFVDEQEVDRWSGVILNQYLFILAITSVVLAMGMYAVGWRLVGRVRSLGRRVDATLPEDPAGARRGGDEVSQLAAAFEDLRGRLDRSRERLVAQQRLATAGKIASSVAHEVRNPLQAMKLTLEMMRGQSTPAEAEGFDLVLGEIDRLGLLADELLVLAGKDTRRVERVELAGEVRETLRLMNLQLRQRQIEARVALPELPAVSMDRSRCRQLLLNLLLNAVEASPRGGAVRVSAEKADGEVTVRVADSGPGFPEAVASGQAEEFYSTKATGAGLGLSICRRIVAEAGGRMRLYNDRGAVAEVVLPVA